MIRVVSYLVVSYFIISCAYATLQRATGANGTKVTRLESQFATKTTYQHRTREDESLFWEKGNIPEDLEPILVDAVLRHGTRYPSTKRVKLWEGIVTKFKVHVARSPVYSKEVKSGIASWKNWFHENSSYLLSSLGWKEHLSLGYKYYSMMPNLWSQILPKNEVVAHDDLLVQSSRKVRSLASARAFLSGLQFVNANGSNDFQHPNVRFEEFKVSREKNQEDENNIIQFGLIPVHVTDSLIRFFEHCEKYVKTVDENDTAEHEFQDYFATEYVSRILSETLGTENKMEAYHIYQMCAFEMAVFGHSVWCSIFKKDTIPVFEYASDLKHYYKTGRGYAINVDQSCVLLENIMHRLGNASSQNPRATLRFGHAETLIPLVSLLEFYQEREHLTSKSYGSILNRVFRTGKISPFSANLAIIVYESRADSRRYISFVLNEQIMKPFGLDCYFCDFEPQSYAYRHMQELSHREKCGEVCKFREVKDEL